MRIRLYTSGSESENYVLRAFFEGCDSDDVWIGDLDDYVPSDVAVVFGTYKRQVPISYRRGRVVQEQKRLGLDTVILETGYLNRGASSDHHYAVGLNGLNGRANFKNKNSPPDRANRFREKMRPWREDGNHILLCGQVPWDASVDHIDFMDWVEKTAGSLQTMSNRPVIYRAHPLVKTPAPYGTTKSVHYWLQDDLHDCWCVVTFNSNSAVEAVMEGIPVVACDEGSMALSVANTLGEVNNPKMPDRQQWLNNLCYAQWTPGEMSRGLAWNQLFK